MAAKRFDPKDYQEVVTLSFEFAEDLGAGESIQAPVVCTIAVHSGEADPSPGAVLSGGPQISGTRLLQQVAASVPGSNYYLRAKAATSLGRTLVIGAVLPSVKAGL